MSTTVLLVDDHELIRQGLRRAFERAADFEVVGEAGSIAEAFRKGNMGIMDYYRIKNIQADTNMRENIGGPGHASPDKAS